jgi:hypothetical protein
MEHCNWPWKLRHYNLNIIKTCVYDVHVLEYLVMYKLYAIIHMVYTVFLRLSVGFISQLIIWRFRSKSGIVLDRLCAVLSLLPVTSTPRKCIDGITKYYYKYINLNY